MALKLATPAVKIAPVKIAPVNVATKTAPKGVKTHSFITVDKNNYTAKVSALANSGAIIIGVTVSQDMRNSYDIHYYTV
jgi:hypothetical protein